MKKLNYVISTALSLNVHDSTQSLPQHTQDRHVCPILHSLPSTLLYSMISKPSQNEYGKWKYTGRPSSLLQVFWIRAVLSKLGIAASMFSDSQQAII